MGSLGLKHLCGPFCSFFAQFPVVNDDLPARIISGRVQVKSNVKEFRGSSVVFEDGSIIDKVCMSTILSLQIFLYVVPQNPSTA